MKQPSRSSLQLRLVTHDFINIQSFSRTERLVVAGERLGHLSVIVTGIEAPC